MEFEWTIFLGFPALQILAEIQNMMTETKVNLSNSMDELTPYQCFTTLYGEKTEKREACVANSLMVADYARKFAQGHWSFLGPGSEKKWYGTHVYTPNGEWDDVADMMMINLSESGHPVSRVSIAFERRDLKSKGKGKLSIHFNGSDETVEVILRKVISVNQLSVYGAVAEMCDELACIISGSSERTGGFVDPNNPETMVIPTELSTTNKTPLTNDNVRTIMNKNSLGKFPSVRRGRRSP